MKGIPIKKVQFIAEEDKMLIKIMGYALDGAYPI